MADSLLDNYNPLYDIHLRQYFALPHMQKHLQKMGLLESTLNLNDDQVYARHHAMMDMMLKNREAQLVKMAELRKKLDAAEKVECCRRIRTGHSPESYRQGKPSRSLSRNRAGQKNGGGSGGRQRRYSNSFEDRDFVQRIEERNADPVEQNTRDPYKRLSANAKRFNYLHKLDDNTLVAYKDNLKKQLQRLERFREISFGPHSVARQPPPPQASWFFRRRSLPSLTASAPGNTLKEPLRSVLNMRGRKATTGNKLNASHDSRTSCPPTTRKRKDSNTRLPPIHPPKNRVPTKPPAPVSLQQITTKLPPAAKKPAPTRGRPSNKRQTTTTTTTITSVSKSPPIADTTLPQLPSVTGHGIFTGAAAAATAAAIGTAALNMDALIGQDEHEEPVLETQKTFDRDTPADQEEVQAEILDALADQSEKVAEQEEQEFIPRQVVLDNTPINHGDYEDSDSEPEYAEEDRETPVEEETIVRQEVGQQAASPIEPVDIHAEPVKTPDSPKEIIKEQEPSNVVEETPVVSARTPPTLIFTEQSTEENADLASDSGHSEHSAQQSPIVDVHSTHVVEHFETHDATPQSPVVSVHGGAEHDEAPQSPVLSVHSSHHSEHHEASEHADRQSPVLSVHSSHHSENIDSQTAHDHAAPQSPVLSIQSSHYSEHHEEPIDRHSPIASEHADPEPAPQSPVLSIHSSHHSEQQESAAPQSPVSSVHSSMHQSHHETADQPEAESQELSHHSDHFSEHHDASVPVPQSSAESVHHSESQDQDQVGAQSPLSFEHVSEHHEASIPVSANPVESFHRSEHQDQNDAAPHSPVLSVHSSHHSEHHDPAPLSPAASEHHSEHLAHQMSPPQSPVASEKDVVELSPSIYSSQASEQLDSEQHRQDDEEEHSRSVRSTTMESSVTMMQESFASEQSPAPVQAAPQSPVTSEKDITFERAPSVHSQGSEGFEHVDAPIDHHVEDAAPQSPVVSGKDGVFERASSVHSSHASEHLDVPSSPIPSPSAGDSDEKEAENPLLDVHTSSYHEPAPHSPVDSDHAQSPVNAPQSPVDAEQQEIHSTMHQSQYQKKDDQSISQSPTLSHQSEHHEASVPAPQSPAGSVHLSEHQEDHAPQSPVVSEHVHQQANHHIDLTDVPKSPALSMSDSYAPENLEHEAAPKSPDLPSEKDAFVPRSPSVHTSDAEEEHIVVQHHAGLTGEAPPKSPTEMDLYNPSRENQESPVMSESPTPAAIPIADRIDLEAYHNSPTKESTSPVTVNPMEVHVSAEQVAEQLDSPKQRSNFEELIHKSAEEEASHLVQEAMSEAPAIIDMVNAYEEKEKFPEAYALKYDQSGASGADAMMTSIYQPSSEDYEEAAHSPKSPVLSQEGRAHNGDGEHDNISTDSLIIHDNQPDPMTQSIYQPHEKTEENEWDEGNKHVHEVISSSEHTDQSGKHFTETVTTTTTVIKSGDDMENNNGEVDQESGSDEEDDKEKIIEEEEEHGSNGNLVRETITTTTRTITSGGLPEGGILVDDGDEKNISSL